MSMFSNPFWRLVILWSQAEDDVVAGIADPEGIGAGGWPDQGSGLGFGAASCKRCRG